MNILHINSYYSISKFYKNLYNSQVKNGLEIAVFVPVPFNFEEGNFEYGEYTTISKNHNKYDRFLFHLKHNEIYQDITRKYDIKQYDLLHSHSLFSNGSVALRLKKEFGIPYIVAVRNTDINVFFKYMIHLRSTGVNILLNAARVVFLSPVYRERLINNYVPENLKEEILKKSVVIPNGIDDFWLKNKYYRETSPEGKKLKLILVGSITPNKGIDVSVKACELLIEEGYDIELTMIGKVERKAYKKMIESSKFIRHIDYSPKEVIIEHMRKADIYIMPSKHETFGLVYAEAMSQGLPVIYTRGEGFDGQFPEGEVGFHVYPKDPKEVVEKIYRINNDYVNISARCVKKVERFNWDMIAQKLLNLYSETKM